MDYNYLAESLAALAGVPVRIYRDGRFLSLHHARFKPDFAITEEENIFKIAGDVGYYMDPNFLYYGLFRIRGEDIALVIGPVSPSPVSRNLAWKILARMGESVSRTQEVLDALHPYYPQFQAAKNCLETSLSNIGALFHPSPILLNIGRIENDKNGYRYYWDGITPSVAVLVKAVDRERMAVAHAFGVEVLSAEEWLRQSYDTYGDDLYQLLQHNQAYGDIQAPHTIQARYVTEDVPMSLVPISELGHIAGVSTPDIDSVITLTSTIYQRDFRGEGRNAVNLGIQEMTLEQVAHYFETGKKETQPLLMGERKTEAAS